MANWDALSTMIAQGRSFSGRERHCAFLNTCGAGGFADVSAATGLDFAADGRGLAVTDWDGDGDLDLWITQRNGPRIRFLRNDVSVRNRHVALRLEGTACNRDAIGAQVRLTTSSDRKLVRTLRAGEGFLSQSSKVLLFGLLPDEAIEELSVAWPGNRAPELFPVEQVGHRYHLQQGRGIAALDDRQPAAIRTPAPSETSAVARTSPSASRRLVLIRRPEAPEFSYVTFAGDLASFPNAEKPGPVLINLWASWCAPCVAELEDLSEAHEELAAKGLRILALSTDAITEDGEKPDLSRAKALVARGNYPHAMGVVDDGAVQVLTKVLYDVIASQRPLPLPTSFLVDARGKVGLIYLGPVTSEQLLKDIDLLNASPKAVEAASFPFAGRNGIELFTLTPLAFAQAYEAGGYVDDARRTMSERLDAAPGTLQELYFLGALEQSQSNWTAAVRAYEAVLQRSPDQSAIHVPLGVALWQSGRREEARRHFAEAAEHARDRPALWTDLGRAHLQIDLADEAVAYFKRGDRRDHVAGALIAAGKTAEGCTLYEALLRENPENHQVANQLAWALATRSGGGPAATDRALELAGRLGELTAFRDPRVLDTLGAVHALRGDFEEAIRLALKSRRLARATGQSELVAALEKRLRAYEAESPWLEK